MGKLTKKSALKSVVRKPKVKAMKKAKAKLAKGIPKKIIKQAISQESASDNDDSSLHESENGSDIEQQLNGGDSNDKNGSFERANMEEESDSNLDNDDDLANLANDDNEGIAEEESDNDDENNEDFDEDSENDEENNEDFDENDEDNNDDLENESNSDVDDSDNDQDDSEAGNEAKDHKKALERLKSTDPEFYKFLQENDKKLLQFNLSDEESDASDSEEKVHQPKELEVASDESDFEAEADEEADETKKKRLVTLKLIKQWQIELQAEHQKSNATIIEVARAFNAALRSIVVKENEEPSTYKVEGAAVFNGIVQLCVLYLGPAVRKYLNITHSAQAHKAKKFIKIKKCMNQYFSDLVQLLQNVTSSNILKILLKHLHYMSPFLASFSHVTKPLLRHLIKLWGTGDEAVRVVAFLCVLRIANSQPQHLDYVLKTMYMSYVKNSKFVGVSTLPAINFMRRSLVEIYAMDLNAAYSHVFLYIRQLAINLRNAIVDNKKENVHVVCNWQFVNSCRLWGALLGQVANKPQLQSLIYPFVQVCIGTMKLVPTATYFPLRFHLAQVLMDLSRDCGVFVPVMPFLTEVLITYDFNKKHTKVSMKPLNFNIALRMSKSQMAENGFKDAIVESVYAMLLEYMTTHSHSVAFPDMMLLAKTHIRTFLKKCSNAQYKRRFQQLLEKLEQNAAFIEGERRSLSVVLTQTKRIEAWETGIKNRGTPLSTFYESWVKVRNIRKKKEATNSEELADYNLPVLKKRKLEDGDSRKANVDENGKVVLFPSDSEDDDEATNATRPAKKRGARGKKLNKKRVDRSEFTKDLGKDESGDIVEDITDW